MNTLPNLLCVSANPAIDRRIYLDRLRVGDVNRALKVNPSPGGKAAHVAFVAQTLGAKVRWIAFLGGAEGEACRAGMAARGVTPIVVPIEASTRTNLELIDSPSRKITEILEPGPPVTSEEKGRFIEQFRSQLHDQPVVVLSGSLPHGIESSFYLDLIKLAREANCRVILDTSGEALAKGIEARPHLIKPNLAEASDLLGRTISSTEEVIQAGQELRQRGSKNVIISSGPSGAVLVSETSVLKGTAPKIEVLSTVGSGDSFLAGWSVAEAEGKPIEECLRSAIACGTANCLAESPGIFSRDSVAELSSQIVIRECAYTKE